MGRLLVEAFEEDVSGWTGGVTCVALSSAGAALHVAYAALGVGAGDEVVTTPLAEPAAAVAASSRGAQVVFADVEDDTATLDPKAVADVVGPRTRVITAVDYAGHPADYDDLRTLADGVGAAVIADGGEALGATYRGVASGGLADLTTFLVGTGSSAWAGVLAVAEEGLLGPVRDLREPASTGLDLRLPGLLAAVGRGRLRRLSRDNARRGALVGRYRRLLGEVAGLRLPVQRAWVEPAWRQFPVRVLDGRADQVERRLHWAGVALADPPPPVYWRADFAEQGYRRGLCPVAERIWSELIWLPLDADLSYADQDLTVETVRTALGA
jgi:perosamine synthetase